MVVVVVVVDVAVPMSSGAAETRSSADVVEEQPMTTTSSARTPRVLEPTEVWERGITGFNVIDGRFHPGNATLRVQTV